MAAQGVSKRVADEYYSDLGDMVGFRVGRKGGSAIDCQKVSKNTRIEFVTEGLLLFQLIKSPDKISNYDCIIIDEAHERNKETDLLLALLRQHLMSPSPSIKLVVMSATISVDKFCEYFGGEIPTIDCPGRNFDVEEHFCPDRSLPQEDNCRKGMINIDHAVNVLFEEILYCYGKSSNFEDGDVLIFLSSSAQITLCVDKINARANRENMPFVVAYPLYAQMNEKDKEAAKDHTHRTGLDKTTNGRHEHSRKIICCTNIAETSLTINLVRFVVEGGYAKKVIYDHVIRSRALTERIISRASARQRKGRAGRTAPGRCYYLYSEASFESMESYDHPQILDIPVDELIIYSLKVCGKSIEHLGLLDCPNTAQIEAAKERLSDLGMIKVEDCNNVALTEDGEIASRLSGLNPQAVRMILAARSSQLDCLHRAIKLGVLLSSDESMFISSRWENGNTEDPSVPNYFHDLGDHFVALTTFEKYEEKKKALKNNSVKALKRWCSANNLIYYVVDRIQSIIEQSYKELKKFNFLATDKDVECELASDTNERLLKACISGYFSQLAEWIPFWSSKKGFSMLSPTHRNISALLCKESCLYNILSKEEFEDGDEDDDSDDDEDDDSDNSVVDEENDNDEKNRLKMAQDDFRKTGANFTLYTEMFSIERPNKPKLILIPKISLIDVKWIKAHAPPSWVSRINFDENKSSICRRTIARIGPDFLRASLSLYREKNYYDELSVVLHIVWEKSKLFLYGKPECVSEVIESIKNLIKSLRDKKLKADCVKYWPDNSVFGPGLQLKNFKSDSFLIKGGKKTSDLEGYKYWNVKNEHKKGYNKMDRVTIFINDGNDASIFCRILKEILPKEASCNVDNGRIHVSFRDNDHMNTDSIQSVVDTLKEAEKYFSPETVDKYSCNQACNTGNEVSNENKESPKIVDDDETSRNQSCKTENEVSSKNERNTFLDPMSLQRLKDLWMSLDREWETSSLFWQNFCASLEKGPSKVNVNVKYVPSRSRFEIYTSTTKVEDRLKIRRKLIKELLGMCQPKNYVFHELEFKEYSKQIIWKVAAVVEEMRKKFVSIRFSFIFKTSQETEYVFSDDDDDHNSNSDGMDNSSATSGCWTDLERLVHFIDQVDSIHSISIMLQNSSSSLGELQVAKEQLAAKLLPEEAIAPFLIGVVEERSAMKQKKKPKCCMCVRNVFFPGEVQKKKRGEEIDIDTNTVGNTTTDLIGYRLSLCGCIYCRECFFNSVSMKLRARTDVIQCERCDSVVLAKDCEKIIKHQHLFSKDHSSSSSSSSAVSTITKRKPGKFEKEKYQSDWKRIVVLCYQNSCSKYTEIVPATSFLTCQDCNQVNLFNLFTKGHKFARNSFLYCRNLKCQHLICTKCGLPHFKDCLSKTCLEENTGMNTSGQEIVNLTLRCSSFSF